MDMKTEPDDLHNPVGQYDIASFLGNIRNQLDSICEEKDAENVLRIKVEDRDGERLASQENTKMLPISSSYISPNLTPFFEVQIDEMDTMKKIEDSDEGNKLNALKFSDNHEHSPDIQFQALAARMRLSRVPFYRTYTLKRHKMRHSGEKPYKCEVCDYSSKRSTDLRLHRMIHSGEKPLKCEDCDYSCIHPSNMKKHKMIHSGKKPFKCEQCDYSCVQLGCLKKHKMVHTGDQSLKPAEYSRSFKRFKYL